MGLVVMAGAARGGFTVTDLGVLPPGRTSQGSAINVFGQVAGTASVDSFSTVAVRGGSGGLSAVGFLPGGSFSQANGINDPGQIAGTGNTAVADPNGGPDRQQVHAFRTIGGGSPQDLGTFGDDTGSAAYAINASGHVAGVSTRGDGTGRAVIGLGKNSFIDLGSFGGNDAAAYGINGNDGATGWATTTTGLRHAFRSGGGGLQDLGTLSGTFSSEGRAINLAGDVVGFSGPIGASRAFLAVMNRPLLDLGSLPFGSSSEAFGLNNADVVVGQTDFASGPSHAFVYDPKTAQMYDLNDLIAASSDLLLISAAGVNDSTQIVGTAIIGNASHAVLLTPDSTPFLPIGIPVPEPSSWLLLALGGLGVAYARRFRRGRRPGPDAV